ncbi:AI-2E family transporter [Nocardia sp. CA2R105]|uniref:AI-2E family transporter n=1 Tax=Nocardia coffeae TaxID=2873381 RepID=UPI001CA74B79|nr:AI-2E family transporter [Nocardia coffeae]MBY8862227.1 AI-2E family transporter [Nocardia coffeae]
MNSSVPAADDGHDSAIGQPHSRGGGEPITAAEAAAARASTPAHPLGRPGRLFDRRSPFLVGMTGAAGVAVTYALIQAILAAGQALTLIVVAFFLAVGLEPAVSLLVRRRLPRWAAVTVVLLLAIGLFAGFLAVVVPPLVSQGAAFAHKAPDYLHHLGQRYPIINTVDSRFHLQDQVRHSLSTGTSRLAGGVLDIGRAIFGAVTATAIVFVLTAYFMVDFTRVRSTIYRLFPSERRPRAILIGDEIFAKVGAYILGNLVISLITGVLTLIWLLIFGVPYALVLAVLVAVLDLIPIVGSTAAGVIVAVVSLTVSVPVMIATGAFFIGLRLVEDYLLVPRIIGRAVRVPALVTVISVLLGGALLGVIGALLAIPVAAAVLLVVRETVFPSLDETPVD